MMKMIAVFVGAVEKESLVVTMMNDAIGFAAAAAATTLSFVDGITCFFGHIGATSLASEQQTQQRKSSWMLASVAVAVAAAAAVRNELAFFYFVVVVVAPLVVFFDI